MTFGAAAGGKRLAVVRFLAASVCGVMAGGTEFTTSCYKCDAGLAFRRRGQMTDLAPRVNGSVSKLASLLVGVALQARITADFVRLNVRVLG